jgi:hypothetical protein
LEDTTIEDVLKTVETYHDQKNYAGALSLLEENQGKMTPAVWHYNMGTIQAKLENYPLARYHLLMAEKEGLSSSAVTNNKILVESKLDIPRWEIPTGTSDYLINAGLIASQGILTSVSFLLVIFGIISLWKRASLKLTGSFFISTLLVLGLNWWIHSWNKVIVITPQIIHEGPSGIFEGQTELPEGVMLVISPQDGWARIIFPSRFQGWIKDAGFKELK